HLILQVEELPRKPQGFYYQFQVPALVEVPVLSTSFTFEFVPLVLGQARYNEEGYNLLDSGVAKNPLVLRNWHPGDAYQPKGHRRQRKLKEMFQRDRKPLRERECWPIIVAEDQIVWARRWGVAVRFSPAVRSTEAVLIQETEPRGGRVEDRSG
ncbi:MAG: tRNA lysidine(34) synthetase TilS, partial [bacterium]|nr:tRNA lysidine(34) synthetase TilS [bacterium]